MRAHFAPLGIALEVEADDAALICAVAETCRGWEARVEPDVAPLSLQLELGPVAVGDPVARPEGACLSIRGGVEAWADAARGSAWCRLPSAAALGDPAFRERVLDSLVLWMLTRRGRTPVHAAAFVAGGAAILLAGPSGSGKSCLAWAACRAGFALLSDDTVYVETLPRLRLWGIPRPIHLFPEDAPEHADAPLRLRNGKRKRAIVRPPAPGPITADAAVLCLLARGDGVALEPLDPAAALAVLGPPEPGFDLLAHDIEAALRRIADRGAWRLTLGNDPREAIRLLAANLPRLAEKAAR